MTDMVERLHEAEQGIWLDRPEDVERMVRRNYDTGKEFSVWAYTWGYLGNLGDVLYDCQQVAKEDGPEADARVLSRFMGRQCTRVAGALEHAAHMDDCCQILREAAAAFDEVSSFPELKKLARALQRYLMQLSFWVDMELPWAKVCALVDREWHEARK